ncbi:hypothetical protein DHEL01_v204000 [Diaporthe helianthi]|uniref:Uncharacterized protein n=1 Tax=Diaporthe helianthi TaxID=158607 RepID=A0A2P5I523_DIAHE|nr:hypothetical protein DHEL01_v204000 [Diaporthe helianthi]
MVLKSDLRARRPIKQASTAHRGGTIQYLTASIAVTTDHLGTDLHAVAVFVFVFVFTNPRSAERQQLVSEHHTTLTQRSHKSRAALVD